MDTHLLSTLDGKVAILHSYYQTSTSNSSSTYWRDYWLSHKATNMSLYSLAVTLVLRVTLFVVVVTACVLFSGLLNFNIIVLAAFLSSVAPVPAIKQLSDVIEKIVPSLLVLARFWLSSTLYLGTLSCQPFIVVFNYVFFSRIEDLFCVLVYTLRYFIRRTGINCHLAIYGPFVLLLIVRAALSSLVTIILWSTTTGLAAVKFVIVFTCSWITEHYHLVLRAITGIVLGIFSLILLFPWLDVVCMYSIYGEIIPGTFIRFGFPSSNLQCTFLEHQFFLEYSFCIWTLIRLVYYYLFTRTFHSSSSSLKRSSTRDIYRIVKVAQHTGIPVHVIALATIIPCTLSVNWMRHVINNGICMCSLIVYLKLSEELRESSIICRMYDIGTIALVVQSGLVSVYQIFQLLCEKQDGIHAVFTCTCCAALWVLRRVVFKVLGKLISRMTLNDDCSFVKDLLV